MKLLLLVSVIMTLPGIVTLLYEAYKKVNLLGTFPRIADVSLALGGVGLLGFFILSKNGIGVFFCVVMLLGAILRIKLKNYNE